MPVRLSTVRAKLTVLVSLAAVVMFAALPVLSWLLHRQLVDEVHVRVAAAERGFQQELEDDLADVKVASRVLAMDTPTVRAIARHDAQRARRLAQVFFEAYPGVDVLLVDAGGGILAQVGVARAPERIDEIAELADVFRGRATQEVVEHGCESPASGAPPAYAIGTPLPGGGAVVVCLPLDAAYMQNSSEKLGLQLALALTLQGGDRLVGRTADFPPGALEVGPRRTTILDVGDRAWAVARFAPDILSGPRAKVGVLAALDVTDVHRIVQNNLLRALAVLAFAAAVSLVFGSRLASKMSSALRRVNVALKKVEQLEYVHVDPVRTGDELEDLAVGFNRMVDGLKERDNLRTTFGKYMTSSVVDHLLAGKVALGGESLRVTILFTDIRGFTSISEGMDPQRLVALLNEYFTEMVSIVMDEGGVVDKYIGDAVMAVFGAPVPTPDDAVNAVRAAVRMRRALRALNERLAARQVAPLRTGIGIHTGDVVAGNIGSERRMEYTVIGDAVNLASRLESSTKDLRVDVAISEDTYALTKHVILARAAREIVVKGRNRPVMTYELLGMKGEPPLEMSDSAKTASVQPTMPEVEPGRGTGGA